MNGNAGTFIVQTDEVNEKKRKANLGKKHSEETKRKLSQIGKEKTRTEDFKQKVSQFHTGRKRSDETCKKIGDAHRGKVISPELRLKMSEAKKGKPRGSPSPETIEKIRASNVGKIVSEETKIKIRLSVKDNGFFSTEQGRDMARKRNGLLLEQGRHPSQIMVTCIHCLKQCSKSMHTRWHGDNCKEQLK